MPLIPSLLKRWTERPTPPGPSEDPESITSKQERARVILNIMKRQRDLEARIELVESRVAAIQSSLKSVEDDALPC